MTLELAKVYPSVVPEIGAAELDGEPKLTLDLGQGMLAILVEDFDDTIENVSPVDARELGLPEDDLWDRAFQNLGALFASGAIPVQVGTNPSGEKTSIVGPHWLASSMLSSPGLQEYFAGLLGSKDLLAHLPGRDIVVFAPYPCSAEIAAEAVNIVSRVQSEIVKPWADLSFVFTQEGIRKYVRDST